MTEENIQEVENSISHLESQLSNLRELKEKLESLSEREEVVSLNVSDAVDSPTIIVDVVAEEPLEEMAEIAGMGLGLVGDSIKTETLEYRVEDKLYVLTRKFRIDR